MEKEENEYQIFKIQKPINSSVNSSLLLIYNEDYSIYSEMNITQELAKLLGTNLKIYVLAKIEDGILCIKEKVENQIW